MAVVKTYNVIVNVGVNTKDTAKGNAELKRNLQSYEREVSDSRKRMQADEQRFLNDKRRKEQLETQINQDEAIRRFNNKQRDIQQKQQLYDEARKKEEFQQKQHLASMAENDRIALAQKRQRVAQSDKERLKEALKAHQDVENLITNSALKDLGKHKGQSRDANKVLDFSKKTIDAEMANIDKIIKGQRITDANRILDSWTKKTRESTQSMGMWGQAFKGAFIGAIAGIAFSTIVSGITGIVGGIKDLIVESVQLAGNFEVTKNAMTLFTGSSELATKELSQLKELAKDTNGLRLDDAYQGATALRALGFEAEITQNLIKGIAIQKLRSGTTDENAIQRVIINLQQLRAGSPQIQRDIRQMILALPSLSLEINKTFGSVAKFQKAIQLDSGAALDKFAKGLSNAEAPVSGLNDSIGKLKDEFIEAGIEFGTPILDPLTRDIKLLTEYVRQNEDGWKSLGQTVADFYNGLSLISKEFSGSGLASAIGTGIESFIDRQTNGVYTQIKKVAQFVEDVGRIEREFEEKAKRQRRTDISKQVGIGFEAGAKFFQNGVINSPLAQTKEEIDGRRSQQVIIDNAGLELTRQLEKDKRERLEIVKSYYDEKISIIESGSRRELALLDSQITYTLEQEIEVANKRAQITQDSINKQIAEAQKYYQEALGNENLTINEKIKLQFEYNQKIRGLNDQSFEVELRRQKEVAEKERQILEKRRQTQIESFSLMQRETNQFYDRRISDIQKNIDSENITISNGYNEIETLTQERFDYLRYFMLQQYDLRQQDLRLTAEERKNLEKESYLELEDLTRQHNEKLLELNNERFDKTRQKIEEENKRISELMQKRTDIYSSFSSILEPNLQFGENASFAVLYDIFGQKGALEINESIENVLAGTETIFQTRLKYLDKIRERERENLDFQLRAISDLMELEQRRGLANEKLALQSLITRRENAILYKQRAESGGRITDAQQWQDTIDGINSSITQQESLIQRLENGEEKIVNEQTKSLQNRQQTLEADKNTLSVNQNIERSIEEQNFDLDKIRETYEKITSGQKDRLIVQLAELNLSKERNNAAEELRKTQLILSDENLLNLTREIAMIRNKNELYKEELNAILRIDKARLELANKGVYSKNQDDANVLEFLAQQKGITEIVSDAKINSITLAYQGLDKVAQSIAKSFGAAKDSVSQFISSLLKLALNKLFQKLFGINADGTSVNIGGGNGKGFSLFGNGRVTQTPNYNPNASNFSAGAFANYYHQISSGGNSNATNFSGANSASPFQIFADALNGGSGTRTRAVGEPVEGGFKFPGLGLLKPGKENGANTQTPSNVRGGITGLIGSLLPILGGSLGSSLGQGNTGASLLGSIGGLAGGLAAGIGTGLIGTGATAGFSVFGTVLSATAATGILAAIAAPALLGAFFWGRNARRRKEEKLRNTAMADAFKQLDKLIEDVNADRIDGASAIEQAEQIRANYVEQMNQLKDKKTRSHALKDVSRIDAKISELKSAVAGQKSRRERLELFAPTFADGGSVSSFGRNNFRNNPLGYQQGGRGTSRSDSMVGYFPRSNSYARFSNSEYILDAETTSRIGVHNLDLMRQTKGASFNSMLARTQGRAFGGAVGQTMTPIVATPTAQTSSQPIEVHIHVDGSAFGQIIAQAISVAIKSNDGSTSQMNELKKSIENEGQNGLVQAIAQAVKLQLNIR